MSLACAWRTSERLGPGFDRLGVMNVSKPEARFGMVSKET